MNEIISRLDEIEEKAGAIISDARLRQEQLREQAEEEMRLIDERYRRQEEEELREYKKTLLAEADREMDAWQGAFKQEIAQFVQHLEAEKEAQAQTIVERLTAL